MKPIEKTATANEDKIIIEKYEEYVSVLQENIDVLQKTIETKDQIIKALQDMVAILEKRKKD